MTDREAIDVLINEWKCIARNDGIHCDRKCESCDLVMDVEVIREAYSMAISALQAQEAKRSTYEQGEKMNRQRKVVITVTYNDLGVIVDTKAEELDSSAQPNLQPTCNQLATNLQPMLSTDRMQLMGVAVHDSNLHAKQASGLELRRHIEVSRNWQWDRYSGGGEKRSRWRNSKV